MNGPAVLPQGDRTPAGWTLPREPLRERWLRRPLRALLYPGLTAWRHRTLVAAYGPDLAGRRVDRWLRGHRGFDYPALRARLARHRPIRGARVVVLGCGTGRDIPSWWEHAPAEVTGVDWFDHARAWSAMSAAAPPGIRSAFLQGDAATLDGLCDGSADIIGSDAVFEHLTDLPAVLRACRRVLAPGGALYAGFGPLWKAWGGDHISGTGDEAAGYNHLLLPPERYQAYLAGFGPRGDSQHDGRIWADHGLFSRLSPRQYLDALEDAGFRLAWLAAVIDPRGERVLPAVADRLGTGPVSGDARLDHLVTGMAVIAMHQP